MTKLRADHAVSGLGRRDATSVIAHQVRAVLTARAERLGLDPVSIFTPAPGVLVARSIDGLLLRVDFRIYQAHELER